VAEDEIFMTRRRVSSRPHNGKVETMYRTIQKSLTHPLLALGSTLLWGVIELVALNRRLRSGR